MKIVSIVGARPQFIKAAALSRVIRQKCTEILVHTGQHYDENMSEVFFRELEIPHPDCNLGIASDTHAKQTGLMMIGIEKILQDEKPDCVLVYGDTNSTLAGALAGAKLNMPVVHVEAGLRSFNRRMPEEINRVLTDHVSTLLFCPSDVSVKNLSSEGITEGVHLVGDIMADVLIWAKGRIQSRKESVLKRLGIEAKQYYLASVHRAENVASMDRLTSILNAFSELAKRHPVIFPVHPRTRKAMDNLGITLNDPGLRLIEPVGYLDMIALEQHASVILADSGGMQKEAYWLGVPCVTLRDETEWVETVTEKWNTIAGVESARIIEAVSSVVTPTSRRTAYGDGASATQIADHILSLFDVDHVV